MKTVVALLLFLSFPALLLSQDTTAPFAEYGELLHVQLSTAPFPHPARVAGHTYGHQLFPAEKHYNDSSVAIFIPKGFRQTDAVDFIVHIHGWWNNIDTALRFYKLPQQLFESGKNAILVLPEGPRNAPDSFLGKLEDPGGFERFIDDVVAFLVRSGKIKTPKVGTIVLDGHSGAYHGMSFIVMRGGMPENVREVYLFDALYGETEKFAYWIDHAHGKLIDIYTDSGGTKGETESLMEDLDAWKIPYVSKVESAISADDLRNNRLIFIHSDLEHNMVVSGRMQLRDYLKASRLSDR